MSEVIVVGAGHNGLICAAYLARAGIETLLLEARDDVGGCASTVSDLGARFNICNCDHTMIRAMPVIDELELESFGLQYLEPDAGGVNMYYDGSDPWLVFHETERMLDSLNISYPSQVEGYRCYLRDAMPVAKLVLDMASTKPSASRLIARALSRRVVGAARLLDWSRRSVDDVFADYFDDWHVTMPAISTGPTVWGVHPATPGTGLAALSYASRHLIKTGRPKGGSGALTDATRASFEAAGGTVRCAARVDSLVVRDGQIRGVRLTDGTELRSNVVVAACDPQRVFVDWIDSAPPAARRLVDRWRAQPVGDGYESKIDAVLSERPRYRSTDLVSERFPGIDIFEPTTIVSPSRDALADAHTGRSAGRVAAEPTLLVNVPSVLDPTMLTSDGGHILSLEVLFTPYALKGGWPNSTEPDRWLDLWADFVEPGMVESITARRAMTPDRYEAEFSMHRGHTPSYAGSPLAALVGQRRELTRYRSPIAGLYLSGAGTFPGAGIFGAAGRNTADVVRRDLRGPVGRPLTHIRQRAAKLGA
ncbi:MAG: NAD(P)/FAD-dependent oxidoreductase [Acidimicrobiales bacterium]